MEAIAPPTDLPHKALTQPATAARSAYPPPRQHAKRRQMRLHPTPAPSPAALLARSNA